MTKTIYADVLFLINFIINYLILFTAAHIGAIQLRRWRLIVAAMLGAIYGVAVFLPMLSFLTSLFFKLFTSLLMVLCAFGFHRLFKNFLLFLAISVLFAGAVFAVSLLGKSGFIEIHNGVFYIHMSFLPLIATSIAAYIFLSFTFKKGLARSDRRISRVTLVVNNTSAILSALHDTGNALRNPKDNTSVVITDYPHVRALFPNTVQNLMDNVSPDAYITIYDKLAPLGIFSLIPYKTVGVSFSLMLAFSPDKILLDGKKSPCSLVAISPFSVSDGDVYNAVI